MLLAYFLRRAGWSRSKVIRATGLMTAASGQGVTRAAYTCAGGKDEDYSIVMVIAATLKLASGSLVSLESSILYQKHQGLHSGAPGHSLMTSIVYVSVFQGFLMLTDQMREAYSGTAGITPDEATQRSVPTCWRQGLKWRLEAVSPELLRRVPWQILENQPPYAPTMGAGARAVHATAVRQDRSVFAGWAMGAARGGRPPLPPPSSRGSSTDTVPF